MTRLGCFYVTAKYRSPSYFRRLARRKALRDHNVTTDGQCDLSLAEKVMDVTETSNDANDPEIAATADVLEESLLLHRSNDVADVNDARAEEVGDGLTENDADDLKEFDKQPDDPGTTTTSETLHQESDSQYISSRFSSETENANRGGFIPFRGTMFGDTTG